jgi:hypothetical protein
MIYSILDFILLSLATFRLTRLFVFDNITQFLRKPFIHEYEERLEDGTIETYIEVKGTGIRKFVGELLSCYWCTGVWCAAIMYGGYSTVPIYFSPIIIILSIAGCASILETVLLKIMD